MGEADSLMSLLRDIAKRYTDSQTGPSPFVTAVPGLTLLRAEQKDLTNHHICRPALCLVVQGAKWTMIAGRRFDYHEGQALVVSVEMPAFSTIAAASESEPYLGIIIEFDLSIMREVVSSLETLPEEPGEASRSVFVTDFEGPLADSALRILQLLDRPQAIAPLYPALMREMCYWLLAGSHGGEVLSMTVSKLHTRSILSAIHFLRDRFAESVSIEQLASIAQMSSSALQRQFKSITSMTPLQYQKQLRLLEARRMMVTDEVDVKTTAFQVGYESSTHFSREYSRMFGQPPRRDVVQLRDAAK